MNIKEKIIKSFAIFVFGSVAVGLSMLEMNAANPLAYLFQIMFILFFISPPIIAVMLFLIWKELKAKNKMK